MLKGGTWVRPAKQPKFHFRYDALRKFLCGLEVKNTSRDTENMFASYSNKCEECLLAFMATEEASKC